MRSFPKNLCVVDFETHGILPYPDYPPKPCGASIRWEGGAVEYLAWGHAVGNNVSFDEGRRAVMRAFLHPCLMHNAAFDMEVARVHMGLPYPEQWHDSMFMAFLCEPHSLSLGLKPLAEQILHQPPEEQDALIEYGTKVLQLPKAEVMSNIPLMPAAVVGPYAIGDVKRTYSLAVKLWERINIRDMWNAYDRERLLLPWLLDSERRGTRVDRGLLEKWEVELTTALVECDARLNTRFGGPINWDANDEVATALKQIVAESEWPKTKTGKLSTSLPVLRTLIKDDALYELMAYRNKAATMLRTFVSPWLELSKADGRLHTAWASTRNPDGNGTRTGRIASARPNLANIPNEQDAPPPPELPPLPLLRGALLPEEGHVWMSADYSQQELRLLAHYEDDSIGDLARAYAADPALDMHTYAADLILARTGITVSRKQAKTLAFAILYGAGAKKIASQLGVTEIEAGELRNAYLSALPGVRELRGHATQRYSKGNPAGIRTRGGRLYFHPTAAQIKKRSAKQEAYDGYTARIADRNRELSGFCSEERGAQLRAENEMDTAGQLALQRAEGNGSKSLPGMEPSGRLAGEAYDESYKGLNVLIQGSAADQTKTAIIKACAAMPQARLLCTVYDEINVSVPADCVLSAADALREAMTTALPIDVPVLVDIEVGPNWADLKKLENK